MSQSTNQLYTSCVSTLDIDQLRLEQETSAGKSIPLLLAMGYSQTVTEKAIRMTENRSLTHALDWLERNPQGVRLPSSLRLLPCLLLSLLLLPLRFCLSDSLRLSVSSPAYFFHCCYLLLLLLLIPLRFCLSDTLTPSVSSPASLFPCCCSLFLSFYLLPSLCTPV